MEDKILIAIQQNLKRLIGLYRELLNIVRQEKDAIITMNVKDIQEATRAKEAILSVIRYCEMERASIVSELALKWKVPLKELTLSRIIIEVQGRDSVHAEEFQTVLSTLTLLIQRVSEQNEENHGFVANSLKHIEAMKKNVLGEANPHSFTYTKAGGRKSGSEKSRLLSKEA